MLKQLEAHILCPKCSERHPPSLPTIPDLWARVKRVRPDGQWKGVFNISVWISWTCTTWEQWYDWVKMSNNSFQRNCEIKFFWKKNTVNCTVRETWSCHFPRNAFSKEWKQTKQKKASQQWMSKDQRDSALQTGPITWTLGAKGVVLLLRLWLWTSTIKQQK